MLRLPLFPDEAIPVLKVINPLTPDGPELDVLSDKDPLLPIVPTPDTNEIAPPVFPDEIPAERLIEPPEPLLPEPTSTDMAPPLPPAAPPELILTRPEFPTPP